MRTRSSFPPSAAAKRSEDFEWPPQADDLAVYEVGPDPWHALQDASSEAFAERHGERSPRQAAAARQVAQRLAGVLAALVIVAAAAVSVLTRVTPQPTPVERVHHHPVVAVAAPSTAAATPPQLKIVATYTAEGNESAAGPAIPVQASVGMPALPMGSVGEAAAPPPVAAAAPELPVAAGAGADSLTGIAAVAAPTAAAPPPAARTHEAGIRALLQRYEDAYDRRDVRTAAALWPSLDRDALERAFASLERQDLEFDRCDIDASDATGSAVCVGTVRYVPRVGRAVEKADRITWTFALARSGDDWHIHGLRAR